MWLNLRCLSRSLLAAAALCTALGLAGCAGPSTRFASADLTIDATRGGKPAANERLIVWIGEQRHEALTNASGEITLSEDYSYDSTSFQFPPVGKLSHSPAPSIDVSLADDPGRPLKVQRTSAKEKDDGWKVHLTVNLDPAS